MLGWLFNPKKQGAKGTAVASGPGETQQDQDSSDLDGPAGAPAQQLTLRSSGREPATAASASESELEQQLEGIFENCEDLLAEKNFNLPMLPSVATKLLDLLRNPDITAKEVSETVRFDPVLSAKFLNLANSAFYGVSTRVDSIVQATTLLGLNSVKILVMSIALNSAIFQDKRLGLIAKTLWEHSIGTALANTKLAAILRVENSHLFLGGLLHDVGKIPALLVIQGAMAKGKLECRNAFFETLIERYHIRAGIALLNHWTLPASMRVCIAAHHSVQRIQDAKAQIRVREPRCATEEIEEFALPLALTVLSDRALRILDFSDEPGEIQIAGSPLAQDLGLSAEQAHEFLVQASGIKAEIEKLPFD